MSKLRSMVVVTHDSAATQSYTAVLLEALLVPLALMPLLLAAL